MAAWEEGAAAGLSSPMKWGEGDRPKGGGGGDGARGLGSYVTSFVRSVASLGLHPPANLGRQWPLDWSDPHPELLRSAQKIDADSAVDLIGVKGAHEIADARDRLAVEGDHQVAG
jgi:hypothetical protein